MIRGAGAGGVTGTGTGPSDGWRSSDTACRVAGTLGTGAADPHCFEAGARMNMNRFTRDHVFGRKLRTCRSLH